MTRRSVQPDPTTKKGLHLLTGCIPFKLSTYKTKLLLLLQFGLWCKQWGRTGRGGDETVSHSAIKNLAACSFQPLHWMRSRKEGTTATTEPQNEAGDFTKWRRHRTPKEPKLRKPTELNVFKCSDSVLPRPLKQDTLPVIVRLSTELMQMICSKDLAIDLFILRI